MDGSGKKSRKGTKRNKKSTTVAQPKPTVPPEPVFHDCDNTAQFEENGGEHEVPETQPTPTDAQTCNAAPPPTRRPEPTKKRSRSDDGLTELMESIKDYVGAYRECTQKISGISNYFEKEAAGGDRRLAIFEEILKTGGFTNQQVIEAKKMILKDAHKVEAFFGLPQILRRDYVMKQLVDANPYIPRFDI
ncbi:hypothetical protein COLO4_11952 [Corchorus olitorius]|uniref:Uncharacterized protein n=1 Tax=Corchorus olitorius TaxID=93759 RepID=A0A1R3K2N6_9ROSI|nr:hypothetical protein COLO4_11952 [Corchorus olitorius]